VNPLRKVDLPMADDTRVTDVPLLLVEGGIHRSAAVEVSVGETDVGSDAANHVVVSDLPAPTAFRLRWDGRSLVLSAVGCDAEVDGKALCRGRDRRLERSSSLVVGGIAFRLKLPMTADTAGSGGLLRGSRSLGAGFAAGIACAAALAGTALIAAPSLPAPSMRFADVSREITGSAAKVEATAPQATHARDGAALLKDFRQQLASAGLDEVSVNIQSDGAVEAVGRIAPAKGEAWRAAVRWFDTAAAGRAVLVDRVNAAAAAASLQVQAVYTGPIPYVIDGEGQKLFVGASLPDGSVIQKIESESVLLKRGDQLVAVRF
jgi:hypothetical protein